MIWIIKAQWINKIVIEEFTRKRIHPPEDTVSEINIKTKSQMNGCIIDTSEEENVILKSNQTVAAKTSNGIKLARGSLVCSLNPQRFQKRYKIISGKGKQSPAGNLLKIQLPRPTESETIRA